MLSWLEWRAEWLVRFHRWTTVVAGAAVVAVCILALTWFDGRLPPPGGLEWRHLGLFPVVLVLVLATFWAGALIAYCLIREIIDRIGERRAEALGAVLSWAILLPVFAALAVSMAVTSWDWLQGLLAAGTHRSLGRKVVEALWVLFGAGTSLLFAAITWGAVHYLRRKAATLCTPEPAEKRARRHRLLSGAIQAAVILEALYLLPHLATEMIGLLLFEFRQFTIDYATPSWVPPWLQP